MYGSISGQVVNKAKRHIVLGSGAKGRTQMLTEVSGMSEMKLPFVYLGVPLFKGTPSKISLYSIFEAVRSKLDGWKGSALSIAGRLQLVKSFAHGKFVV